MLLVFAACGPSAAVHATDVFAAAEQLPQRDWVAPVPELMTTRPLALPNLTELLATAAYQSQPIAQSDEYGLRWKPLAAAHKHRALEEAALTVCQDDCVTNWGGVMKNDTYCDDGAPSTAYCADPDNCAAAVDDF